MQASNILMPLMKYTLRELQRRDVHTQTVGSDSATNTPDLEALVQVCFIITHYNPMSDLTRSVAALHHVGPATIREPFTGDSCVVRVMEPQCGEIPIAADVAPCSKS